MDILMPKEIVRVDVEPELAAELDKYVLRRGDRDLTSTATRKETPMTDTSENPFQRHLAQYRSHKIVIAGEITAVNTGGCTVRCADGSEQFFAYPPGMTSRYTPQRGDYWLVYPDGYKSISPRRQFLDGCAAVSQHIMPGPAGAMRPHKDEPHHPEHEEI